jgi:hypothetical protein
MTAENERLWAMGAHIGTMVLGWLTGGIAFIVAPLIGYLVYKDQSRFVAFHMLQALYFQILYILAAIALAVVAIVLTVTVIGIPVVVIGGLLYAAIAFVVPIVAGIAAYRGDIYEIPIVGPWARTTTGV